MAAGRSYQQDSHGIEKIRLNFATNGAFNDGIEVQSTLELAWRQ
jgi:hypothetical protein